jgi:tetratricopeptide (TPR) repeat protein
MLGALGEFPRFRGDFARAIPIKEEALPLARAVGDDRATKAFMCDLASMLGMLGDFERARTLVAEALEIEARSGDPRALRALSAAAELAEVEKNLEEARRLNQELVDRLREMGDTGSRYVCAVGSLAESLRRLGDNDDAVPLFVEALQQCERIEVFTWVPENLESVAALIGERAPERAAALMGAADAARRETGLVVFDTTEYEAIKGAVRAKLDFEQFDAAWNDGGRRSTMEAIADALGALSASEKA